MKRLAMIALAACVLALAPQPARAGTVYYLYETILSPYASYIIGGPYRDFQTCQYVMNSYPYQSGVLHNCQPHFVPD